jgi:hypothetical protein
MVYKQSASDVLSIGEIGKPMPQAALYMYMQKHTGMVHQVISRTTYDPGH